MEADDLLDGLDGLAATLAAEKSFAASQQRVPDIEEPVRLEPRALRLNRHRLRRRRGLMVTGELLLATP